MCQFFFLSCLFSKYEMLLQEETVLKIKLIETEDRQRPISEVNA